MVIIADIGPLFPHSSDGNSNTTGSAKTQLHVHHVPSRSRQHRQRTTADNSTSKKPSHITWRAEWNGMAMGVFENYVHPSIWRFKKGGRWEIDTVSRGFWMILGMRISHFETNPHTILSQDTQTPQRDWDPRRSQKSAGSLLGTSELPLDSIHNFGMYVHSWGESHSS